MPRGDSLHAARIAAYATSRFGVEVPASAALKLETVARMAELVAASGGRGESNAANVAWRVEDRSVSSGGGGG